MNLPISPRIPTHAWTCSGNKKWYRPFHNLFGSNSRYAIYIYIYIYIKTYEIHGKSRPTHIISMKSNKIQCIQASLGCPWDPWVALGTEHDVDGQSMTWTDRAWCGQIRRYSYNNNQGPKHRGKQPYWHCDTTTPIPDACRWIPLEKLGCLLEASHR